MRYKNDKSNLSSPDSFFSSSKCTKIRFRPGRPRWGSLRRSPRPPSRLGRGISPPHSPPRSTPSASRTRRRLRHLGSQPPSSPHHKILATPVAISLSQRSSAESPGILHTATHENIDQNNAAPSFWPLTSIVSVSVTMASRHGCVWCTTIS